MNIKIYGGSCYEEDEIMVEFTFINGELDLSINSSHELSEEEFKIIFEDVEDQIKDTIERAIFESINEEIIAA